ncbi:Serpin domain containing protein, partial [Asbolus verrucosus]
MKCLILFQIFVVAVIGSEAELQDFAKANNLFTASLYNIESAVEESLSILKANCQYTLHIANKMYVQDDFPINDSFTRDAVEIFHAGIENVDFNKSTEAAGKINEWVEKQTKNKIKNVMDPAILDEYTRVVLVNAIYFKGNWSNPFSEFRTIKKRFFETKNDFIEVDTMHRYSGKFNFYESPELDAKFLEMPYKGDGLSMTIVLPNDIEGLASLERQIGKVFEPQNLEIEEVNVALPKFKIENTLELTSVLKA